jgi:hypothetical protein
MQNYKTVIIVIILLFGAFSHAQQILDDYYQRIEKKMIFDKKYLNVYMVSFQPSAAESASLKNIPRAGTSGTVSFDSKDNVTYQVLLLKENFELDSMVLLTIKKIEDRGAGGESFFGSATGGPQIDTSTILSFVDLQELYFAESPFYSTLYQKINNVLKNDDAQYLLGVRLNEKANKSRGITSPDNTDFLNFAKANSIHKYPAFVDVAKPAGTSRRRAAAPAAEAAAATGNEYIVDASLSHVSFFHKMMDLGFSSISAELNMGTRVLNLVPWQAMTTSIGVRSLFFLTNSAQPNPKNDLMIDAKIMGRMRFNMVNLVDKLPFVFTDKPILNVAPGIIFDITGTRAYNLPFFNFYFAAGSSDPADPTVKFGKSDSSYAYHTFKQWEATISFFWNTSEDKSVRCRFDVGAGNYDVYKAEYIKNVTTKTLLYNKIKPALTMTVNFSPQNVEFLGTSLRFYDNVMTMNFWLRLLELPGQHSFRLETIYVSTPLLRSVHPWEAPGGSSLAQVRYRWGF